MKSNCLFISSRDVTLKSKGAPQCTNRNYLTFCEILGVENVYVYYVDYEKEKSYSNSLFKRLNIILGFYWGLSYKKLAEIESLARDYNYVFIDSSLYGRIAKYLKVKNYSGKIICHFHNIEFYLRIQHALRNPLRLWEVPVVYINERAGYNHSDVNVILNERDKKQAIKRYGDGKIFIIPISMIDVGPVLKKASENKEPLFLFLGSNHYANLHGIRWFIKNVYVDVKMKLKIVGNGLEVLKKEIGNNNIEIVGYIDDLSETILNADCLINPIFKGSGMKVKTCEALMYGKNIIGTKESFEGYDIDTEKIGAVCETRSEFISAIFSFLAKPMPITNHYSRKCFEEKYSFDATLLLFRKLLNSL